MKKICILLFILFFMISCNKDRQSNKPTISSKGDADTVEPFSADLKINNNESLCSLYENLFPNKNLTIYLNEILKSRSSKLDIYINITDVSISNEELLIQIVNEGLIDTDLINLASVSEWENKIKKLTHSGLYKLNNCETQIVNEVTNGELAKTIEQMISQELTIKKLLKDNKQQLQYTINRRVRKKLMRLFKYIESIQQQVKVTEHDLDTILNKLIIIQKYTIKVSLLSENIYDNFLDDLLKLASNEKREALYVILPEGKDTFFLLYRMTKQRIKQKIEKLL